MTLTLSIQSVISSRPLMVTCLAGDARWSVPVFTHHKPHTPSPTTRATVAAEPASLVLKIPGRIQQQASGGFEKQRLFLTGPGGYTAYLGPHSGWRGERREEGCSKLGSAWIRVGGGPLGFQSLLANVKHQPEWELGHGKGEAYTAGSVMYALCKGGPRGGAAWFPA